MLDFFTPGGHKAKSKQCSRKKAKTTAAAGGSEPLVVINTSDEEDNADFWSPGTEQRSKLSRRELASQLGNDTVETPPVNKSTGSDEKSGVGPATIAVTRRKRGRPTKSKSSKMVLETALAGGGVREIDSGNQYSKENDSLGIIGSLSNVTPKQNHRIYDAHDLSSTDSSQDEIPTLKKSAKRRKVLKQKRVEARQISGKKSCLPDALSQNSDSNCGEEDHDVMDAESTYTNSGEGLERNLDTAEPLRNLSGQSLVIDSHTQNSSNTVHQTPERSLSSTDDVIDALWSCEACTFLNHEALPFCELCTTPKRKTTRSKTSDLQNPTETCTYSCNTGKQEELNLSTSTTCSTVTKTTKQSDSVSSSPVSNSLRKSIKPHARGASTLLSHQDSGCNKTLSAGRTPENSDFSSDTEMVTSSFKSFSNYCPSTDVESLSGRVSDIVDDISCPESASDSDTRMSDQDLFASDEDIFSGSRQTKDRKAHEISDVSDEEYEIKDMSSDDNETLDYRSRNEEEIVETDSQFYSGNPDCKPGLSTDRSDENCASSESSSSAVNSTQNSTPQGKQGVILGTPGKESPYREDQESMIDRETRAARAIFSPGFRKASALRCRGPWICEDCGLHNDPEEEDCEGCLKSRPDDLDANKDGR